MSEPFALGKSERACGGCRNTTSSIGISSSSPRAGLAAAFGGFGLWWGAWASSLPAVKSSTGASATQLGLALFAVSLASLPTMVFAGRIADRRRLVPWSLVAFGAAGLLPGFARSPWTLFACLLFVGAAGGLLEVAVNARASRIETTSGIRIMDGVHAAFSAGVLVGGIGAGIARGLGARPTAILPVVAVLVASVAPLNLAALPGRGEPVAPARPRRALIVVGAILAIAFLVENGLETWSALFLERTLETRPEISGLGPGIFAAAMLTGRLVAQRVEGPAVWARMAFAGASAAAGLALAAAAPTPAVALAGFVVSGLGLALSAPTLFGRAGRIGGGAAISTVAAIGYLGFLAGPPAFGAVAGATSLRGGFVFLAAVSVLVALGSRFLRSESDR